MLNNPKMKKMKKLLLSLAIVTITAGTFTSCIENTIPDEIIAIYDGQADLLAAQSAMVRAQASVEAANAIRAAAQAAYIDAQTRAENARAEMQEIANAYASASNAIELEALRVQLASAEADLASQLVQAQIDAELAIIEIARAQATWQAEMVAAAAAVKAAQDLLVHEAFLDYIQSQFNADNQMLLVANSELDVINQMQLMADTVLSDTGALAAYVADVSVKEALLAVQEARLADYEALLAPGSTVGDRIALADSYQASIDALAILIHDNLPAITAASDAETAALNDLDATGYNAVQFDYDVLALAYNGKRDDAEALKVTVAGLEAGMEDHTATITGLESAIADYAGTTTDLEAAIVAADAAIVTANAAVTAANAAKTAAAATAAAAVTADTAADNAVTAATNVLAGYNTAAVTAQADLTTALLAYQTALNLFVDTATLEAAIVTAQGNITTAQANYDAAKIIFDAAPNGTTYPNVGLDGVLGDKSDTAPNSYAEILAVDAAGEATFGPIEYISSAAFNASTDIATGNAWGSLEPAVPGTSPGDIGLFFDVEADDAAGVNNGAALIAAAGDLETAKDNLPVANAALAAQVILNDSSTEKGAYENAADFYASAEADIVAATADIAAATAAAAITNANVATTATAASNAVTAAGNAVTAAGNAVTAAGTAATNLTTHLGTTVDNYSIELERAMVAADVTAADLDAKTTELADLEIVIAAMVANIDAGPAYTVAQNDALALADAATLARIALEAIDATWDTEVSSLNAYIALIDLTDEADMQAMVDTQQDVVDTAAAAIVNAQSLVDNFTTSDAGQEAVLQAYKTALAEAQIKFDELEAIAAHYKAIFDALI